MKVKLGGRPLKYKKLSDLIKVCENYFNKTKVDDWSITGLALAVGSKQLIQDYEKRDGYGDIIKRAKLLVENSYEISLRKHGRTGDIFALKNFGWKDQKEVSHKTEKIKERPKDEDLDYDAISERFNNAISKSLAGKS